MHEIPTARRPVQWASQCNLPALLILVAFVWLLATPVQNCWAQNSPQGYPLLNMVLFVPSDVQPPPGVQRRFAQIAAITEDFLVKEMTKNGYPPAVTTPFPRDDSGNYKFLFIRGEHPMDSGKYDKPGFHPSVIEAAVKKYNLSRDRHIWWIWVYLGDPPKRFSDYRGGGNSFDGGWAICNYTNIPGELDPKFPLAGGLNQDLTLKACIHELGHGLGMPHLGPISRDRRGNTLMGPQTKVYHNKVDARENKVYMCDATAAMLWKHPIFSGSIAQRTQMPKFELTSLQGEFNRNGRYLEITGELNTDIPAHSVVVIEEAPHGGGDYFRKSFAGKVDQNGKFRVKVSELEREQGDLRILFCFENGVNTGDGQGHGDKSGLTRPYKVTRRGVELVEPTAAGS
ncbi:hypothetical protein C5Y96_16420 [Blastopirellula marina]|uniref:Uncharacterized protein n=1 Tax=Blastopirellula marina TaxID=124 RepID=A0A2S8F739_9BACT|nr:MULTISPECIES: hypothetical protein [Pirellulaceae]PQO27963.1 hypothetical protein C5Y96_16420 [Blastopirellula marina]RCS48388.1 hypothetical protein DTL36_16440 [Bremerella cremea]